MPQASFQQCYFLMPSFEPECARINPEKNLWWYFKHKNMSSLGSQGSLEGFHGNGI